MADFVKFLAPVELQAADAKGDRPARFTINAYNGGPMRVAGFAYPVVLDLAGVRTASATIPILLNHDPAQLVGQADETKIGSTRIDVSGAVTGDDEPAQKVRTHARNGFRWQASIGESVERREFLAAGESATVNGRKVTGPLFIARASVLGETSFVPLGADTTTSAVVTASKGKTVEFETWVSAQGFDPSTLTDQQRTSLQASFNGQQSGGTIVSTVSPDVKAERERAGKINAIVERMGVSHGLNDQGQRIENIAAHAIQNGLDPRDVELMVVRATRANVPPPGFTKGGDVYAMGNREALECALVIRAGHEGFAEKNYRPEVLDYSRRYRNTSLIEAAKLCLTIDGHDPTGDRHDMIRAAFSTYSLPNLLSNVANKSLLAGYSETAPTWRSFAAIRSASNFKQNSSIRPSHVDELEQVGSHGELKHGTMDESVFNWSIDTFGKMFGVSRKDIINDDLRVFDEVLPNLGRTAFRKLNDLVWSTILTAGSHYSTANGNYLNDTDAEEPTALSIDALALGLKSIRLQKDGQGNDLDLVPRVLAVAPENETVARSVLNSTEVNRTGDNAPTGNALRSAVSLEVEPRISNTTKFTTNASAEQWFLFCSPQDVPIVVGFLEGIRDFQGEKRC